MEPLLLEMACQHDLQHGDILNLIRGYLEVHCPDSREEYEEGGNPIFYYGSLENAPKKTKSKE